MSGLAEVEERMWRAGNSLRALAKAASGTERDRLWAKYDGLELAKSYVLDEMKRRGEEVRR